MSPAALEVAGELLREAAQGLQLASETSSRLCGRDVARALRAQAQDVSVGELALAYLAHIERPRQRGQSQIPHARTMVRRVTDFCGTLPARELGPNRLRGFRDHLSSLRDQDGRSFYTRRSVNEHVQRVRQMIQWAVGREILPPERLIAVGAVEPLAVGDVEGLRESIPRAAAQAAHVSAVLPLLSRQLRAVVQLLVLTGARPSEVLQLRPIDLDLEGRVAVPKSHKNEWRDEGGRATKHARRLALSSQAVNVLQPWVEDRDPAAFLFSPREAETERRAALQAKRSGQADSRGGSRAEARGERLGGCYRVDSLRQAIARACVRAAVPVWTPYQLRHLALTTAEQALDELHAGALAGHKDDAVTRRYHESQQEAQRARAAADAVASALHDLLGEAG